MADVQDDATALEFIDVEAGDHGETLPALQMNTKTFPVKNSAGSKHPEDKGSMFGSMAKTVTGAKHPVAACFHLLFKGLAMFIYLFGGLVFSSYVFIFVLCIICLAFDFWTVKNISGRLLVGLRWWNRINDDGSNEWIFESQDDPNALDLLDARVFWMGLYATPGIWALLLIVAVLKLNIAWAVIVVVALVLSSANIIGYTKCRKDAKQKMAAFMTQGSLGVLGASAGSKLLSTLGEMAMKSAVSRTFEERTTAGRPQQPMTV